MDNIWTFRSCDSPFACLNGQNVLESLSSSSSEISTKRRILYARSVDKWIAGNDKELETTTWWKYDIINREQVDCLKCSVCTKFND